ncbi:MAG: mechanosensitive ion channel protein MscS [Nitrospira sp. WS110]|nr:mechanosensitive ion channel protein MscS [Nitrospira sp. WS110]
MITTPDFSLAFERVRELAADLIGALPNLILGILAFLLFAVIARVAGKAASRLADRRDGGLGASLVVQRLTKGAVLIFGLLVALTVALPSFHPGDLIQLLGISSVAIGFAFRDILQNFLAGILILFTHPFRLGDQIVAGPFEGTVEDIQTRATFIKTYDGRRIVIPNADLFTQKVIVNTANDLVRVEYDLGIGYGDDIDRAKTLILEAIGKVQGILTEPSPDVIVIELGTSSVVLRTRWWIANPTKAETLDTRDRVLTVIKNTLFANGIDLPFPTQHILFHDQTEESDGDRAQQREGWPAGNGDGPRPRRIADSIHSLACAIAEHTRQQSRSARNTTQR